MADSQIGRIYYQNTLTLALAMVSSFYMKVPHMRGLNDNFAIRYSGLAAAIAMLLVAKYFIFSAFSMDILADLSSGYSSRKIFMLMPSKYLLNLTGGDDVTENALIIADFNSLYYDIAVLYGALASVIIHLTKGRGFGVLFFFLPDIKRNSSIRITTVMRLIVVCFAAIFFFMCINRIYDALHGAMGLRKSLVSWKIMLDYYYGTSISVSAMITPLFLKEEISS